MKIMRSFDPGQRPNDQRIAPDLMPATPPEMDLALSSDRRCANALADNHASMIRTLPSLAGGPVAGPFDVGSDGELRSWRLAEIVGKRDIAERTL